jgi:hypothetical protein
LRADKRQVLELMAGFEEENLQTNVTLVGFALNDCIVEVDQQSAKYLRAIHRSALELSVHNRFGSDIGGFWLTPEEIDELRKLASHYPATEAAFVANAIEVYLRAQLHEFYSVPQNTGVNR